MTLLEKAKEIIKAEGKNVSENGIIEYSCPSDYELEEAKNCVREGIKSCEECCNREMPNTEPKEELFIDFKGELDTEYNKGLNDAWEVAKKFFADMKEDVLEEIFGEHWSFYKIMEMTPQEALAKLKAYEEAQNKIEIGDVVKSTLYVDMNCGVVANITDDKASLVHKDGKFSVMVPLEFLVKTGEHIDIAKILEQIGD